MWRIVQCPWRFCSPRKELMLMCPSCWESSSAHFLWISFQQRCTAPRSLLSMLPGGLPVPGLPTEAGRLEVHWGADWERNKRGQERSLKAFKKHLKESNSNSGLYAHWVTFTFDQIHTFHVIILLPANTVWNKHQLLDSDTKHYSDHFSPFKEVEWR